MTLKRVLEVTFSSGEWKGSAWPGLALSSSSVQRVWVSAGWTLTDVGFVLFSFVSSLSRWLLFGHHLVSLGCHLHRTYLLDGLILSYFSGLVVWWCLLCLSLCPLSPGGLASGAGYTSPAPSLSSYKEGVPCP